MLILISQILTKKWNLNIFDNLKNYIVNNYNNNSNIPENLKKFFSENCNQSSYCKKIAKILKNDKLVLGLLEKIYKTLFLEKFKNKRTDILESTIKNYLKKDFKNEHK